MRSILRNIPAPLLCLPMVALGIAAAAPPELTIVRQGADTIDIAVIA